MSNWNRYPITRVLGWNNPAGFTFTMDYDDELDVITLTSSQNVLSGVESIRLTIEDVTYLIELPDFTIVSETEISIPNASGIAVGTLEQADMYEHEDGIQLVGVATGTFEVAVPLPVTPLISDIQTTGSPNQVRIVGTGFLLNQTDPAESFQVYNTVDTIFGPWLIADPEIISLTDTTVVIEDATLGGESLYLAEVFWNSGVNSHNPGDLGTIVIP